MIPDRLREIAECPCCRGSGIEEVYAGYGNVAEIVCSACDGKAELASSLLRTREERDAAVARAEAADLAFRKALKVLRQSYITLAFAFKRLHESSRSRDGELCLDFQKVRAQIEVLFKEHGVKL